MSLQVNEVRQTFIALLHTSASFTVVGITLISTFLGGNWSRPSGNTGWDLDINEGG